MPYAVGNNRPGFLPEVDCSMHAEWEDAKAALIGDLLFEADYSMEEFAEAAAGAAEAVNLWAASDACFSDVGAEFVTVGDRVYWIQEISDEFYAEHAD